MSRQCERSAHEVVHRRLIDGFVRRVAADPEAEAFALRGGVLVDHWFPTMGRTVRDVDLVCAWPFDPARARASVLALVARDLGDGVQFAERLRADVIWPDTPHPGLRVVIPGRVGGVSGELHADLTFRLPVWPEARIDRLRTGEGLRVCRPQTLAARKLVVSMTQGPRAWRPKDLVDLWWMIEHAPLGASDVGEALERIGALAEWLDGPARPTFWLDPIAEGRWARFLHRHPRLEVPADLARVVGDVQARLTPLGPSSAAGRVRRRDVA